MWHSSQAPRNMKFTYFFQMEKQFEEEEIPERQNYGVGGNEVGPYAQSLSCLTDKLDSILGSTKGSIEERGNIISFFCFQDHC